jgi:hypothetical protein
MSPDNERREGADEPIQALFAAYREACPDPEPSQDFMPQLWQRIEASRSFSSHLKRLAQGIITAAAAAALLMGIYLTRPEPNSPPSYLETLAAGQTHDNLADTEIVLALRESSR